MVGGRTEAVLQVLTGKGRHSLCNKYNYIYFRWKKCIETICQKLV